jgi:enoyl-CoA hydratase
MYQFIKTETKEKLLTITITRANKMNALSIELLQELEDIFIQIESQSLKAVILTSEGGRAFSAGADIKSMSQMSPDEAKTFAEYAQIVFNSIEQSKHMIIAAVDGIALGGGCELAMACDFIYSTDQSKFGQPEVSLGLIPCFGGCLRLPKYVGIAKAKELILTGETINAKEAQLINLVNKVFKDRKELFSYLKELPEKLSYVSTNAAQLSKRVLRQVNTSEDENVLKNEAQNFYQCFLSSDVKRGVEGFLEKKRVKYQP